MHFCMQPGMYVYMHFYPHSHQGGQGRSLTNGTRARQGIESVMPAFAPVYFGASAGAPGVVWVCLVISAPVIIAVRIWLKMSVRVFGVCGINIVLVCRWLRLLLAYRNTGSSEPAA